MRFCCFLLNSAIDLKMIFFISALPYRSEISPYNLVEHMVVFYVHLARGWSPGAQSGASHCFGGDLLLLASMLFSESSCPIGTSNTLSRWASFWLDLGLLAAAVAKGWSPGAQEWCIALFRWGIAIACKHAFRRISYPYRIIELP